MRIDELSLQTVVFVGFGNERHFIPYGTGFIAGKRHRDSDSFFIITAGHVVDLIPGDEITVRANQKGGGTLPIRLKKSSRLPISEETWDLAIFPFPQINEALEHEGILMDREEFSKILKEVWQPELGDETVTIGLYTSHYGQEKNIPVIRIGNIAMLPAEPVRTGCGYVRAYLVETRSIAGLSGSPVFLNIPETRVVRGKLEHRTEGRSVILIGMMLGYHVVESVEDQISVPQYQAANNSNKEIAQQRSLDERNTGFAVVLPIEMIFDALES